MAGIVDGDALSLEPVHRFTNGVVERDGHLRWDLERLFDEVQVGLRASPMPGRSASTRGASTMA